MPAEVRCRSLRRRAAACRRAAVSCRRAAVSRGRFCLESSPRYCHLRSPRHRGATLISFSRAPPHRVQGTRPTPARLMTTAYVWAVPRPCYPRARRLSSSLRRLLRSRWRTSTPMACARATSASASSVHPDETELPTVPSRAAARSCVVLLGLMCALCVSALE